MKYVKMLGLLAVAAASLMAFAGSASATTITSSTGETPELHSVTSVKATLHNAVGTISCDSTAAGKVEKHKEKDAKGNTLPASGKITTLSFTNCTGGTVHTDAMGMVATPGSLSVTGTSTTGNGTLSSTGARVTVTMLGVECGYETNGTDIGEVVGGEHSVLKIKASIPRTHGSIFCGSSGNWTGEYKLTHPTDLTIH